MNQNKYLEKISSILGQGVRAVAGVAKDIASDAGTSIHQSIGGTYRDALHAKLVARGGIKQKVLGSGSKNLQDAGSAEDYIKAHKNLGLPAPSTEELKGLQNTRNKAIVKSIGYAGAGLHVAGKIKERRESQQYY